jgi:hypothetical protein
MPGDGVKTERKSWYKSKTIIVNAAIGSLASAAPELVALIPPQYQVLGVVAINLLLRKFTNQPLGK